MIATDDDIELLVERILGVSDPERLYLFGSNARGDAHSGSDIDLLIVERSRLPRPHRGKRVLAALRSFPSSFDVLVYTPEELAEEMSDPLSFASNITGDGRVIYERGQ